MPRGVPILIHKNMVTVGMAVFVAYWRRHDFRPNGHRQWSSGGSFGKKGLVCASCAVGGICTVGVGEQLMKRRLPCR